MDLLINTHGTRIRSTGKRIVLVFPHAKKREYPARRIEKIIILRPSSISTAAVALAIEHDIDIVYLGSFGTPIGRIFPSSPRGITILRRAQLTAAGSSRSFELAKEFVRGKAQNQITYLKELQETRKKDLATEILQAETLLESLQLVPDSPKGREQLFGIEGYIADKYFAGLKKFYHFVGRKPQGRDKFNSALNYGYGILYNEVERACLYVGLDPYLGLYHAERYGKPSLVLDLVEEFRVPIIDSVVFPLFLSRKLGGSKHYVAVKRGEYQLSPEGKRNIVEAVYQRLNQTVKWEGKNRTVKAVIRHQIQMLGHNFLGKREKYIPFTHEAVTGITDE
jgi:CRISP-associated protein Cas1